MILLFLYGRNPRHAQLIVYRYKAQSRSNIYFLNSDISSPLRRDHLPIHKTNQQLIKKNSMDRQSEEDSKKPAAAEASNEEMKSITNFLEEHRKNLTKCVCITLHGRPRLARSLEAFLDMINMQHYETEEGVFKIMVQTGESPSNFHNIFSEPETSSIADEQALEMALKASLADTSESSVDFEAALKRSIVETSAVEESLSEDLEQALQMSLADVNHSVAEQEEESSEELEKALKASLEESKASLEFQKQEEESLAKALKASEKTSQVDEVRKRQTAEIEVMLIEEELTMIRKATRQSIMELPANQRHKFTHSKSWPLVNL